MNSWPSSFVSQNNPLTVQLPIVVFRTVSISSSCLLAVSCPTGGCCKIKFLPKTMTWIWPVTMMAEYITHYAMMPCQTLNTGSLYNDNMFYMNPRSTQSTPTLHTQHAKNWKSLKVSFQNTQKRCKTFKKEVKRIVDIRNPKKVKNVNTISLQYSTCKKSEIF